MATKPPELRADTLPPLLPGFEHVRRYWDHGLATWVARILPGEYYVSNQGEAIVTVLGSCVACCLRDPVANIAGMNHFMLPETGGVPNWGDSVSAATRYGSYAMEQLINSLLRHGARRERLEAKLFGGSQVLTGLSDIGEMNIRFARKYLQQEAIRILAEDTGTRRGRKVVYLTLEGKVRVRQLTEVTSVAQRETDYRETLNTQPVAGEVELFE